MIQSTHEKVKSYLLKNPGKYITYSQLYSMTLANKTLKRALQDMTCSGRVEYNGKGYRINQ